MLWRKGSLQRIQYEVLEDLWRLFLARKTISQGYPILLLLKEESMIIGFHISVAQ